MSRIEFSESVLQSYDKFEEYLKGEEAIDRIRQEAKKPYVPGEGKLGSLQVAWITATAPLRICSNIFLQAMSILLFVSSWRKEAQDLYVLGCRQALYTSMVLDNYLFSSHQNILVDIFNTVSFDAREIYTHAPIDLEKISCDEDVHELIHPYSIYGKTRLILEYPEGQCGGISSWVAYLYFKTRADFSDPEHHLVSVVKQVSDGAGREATLMQLFVSQILLGMRVEQVEKIKSPTTEKVNKAFKELKPGLYYARTSNGEKDRGYKIGHRMNFAVTQDNIYLIDPNRGLIKENPEELARKLAKNSKLHFFEISV